jgi:hypothetical protein
MPGPDGIITVYGSFRKAKECEEGEAAFTEVVFFGEEFKEIHAATDPDVLWIKIRHYGMCSLG